MQHLKTAAILFLPAFAMGAFAFYLGRAPAKKGAIVDNGPFIIKLKGVERIPVTPLNVADGYDHRFDFVWGASGAKPAWWGTESGGSSGVTAEKFKFFLEREGKITPFKSNETLIWTTRWDKERKRYINKLLLSGGEVPVQSALKVRGVTQMVDDTTKRSAPFPFQFTLKKAGEQWTKSVVSTESGLVVRKITVKHKNAYEREADIIVFAPKGFKGGGLLRMGPFLDGNWREFKHLQVNNDAWKGYPASIPSGFGGGRSVGDSTILRRYTVSWNVVEMKGEPRRDVIATAFVADDERWPLEIAFYAKKDGKQALGVVPALARPR